MPLFDSKTKAEQDKDAANTNLMAANVKANAQIKAMEQENKRRTDQQTLYKNITDAGASVGVKPLETYNQQVAGLGNANTLPPELQAQLAQSRSGQMGAMGLLQDAAYGNAPSAAQMQIMAGADQAVQQQMGMANALRGGFNPAAVRNAQIQGAGIQAQANQQGAILRAQEMAQARGQYFDAANAIRVGDQNSQQLQLGMQQMLLGAYNNALSQGMSADQARLAAAQSVAQYETSVKTGQIQAAAQLEAAKRAAAAQEDAANKAFIGSILATAGTVAGGVFGGPAGAAAGGAAGKMIGGSLAPSYSSGGVDSFRPTAGAGLGVNAGLPASPYNY